MSDHEAAQLASSATRSSAGCSTRLADAGCLWLLFTGGEIFARRDFLDIYTYAKKKGFLITLFTNGTLITPRIADYLVVWRPFAIEITLYGRTKDTYERLTGIPGSYDKCLRGIDLLLERGLPLALKTVAVTVNVHELRDMQQFAETSSASSSSSTAMMNPRIDCSQSPLAVRLSPEDCVALDLEDPRRMDDWKDVRQGVPADRRTRPSARTRCITAAAASRSFAIDPQGGLSICVLSQQDKFDLRSGSLRDGWDGALLAVRPRKITRADQVHDVRAEVDVRDVPGQRRARER